MFGKRLVWRHPVHGSHTSFFSRPVNACQGTRYGALTHPTGPVLRHLRLGSVPVLGRKGPKRGPIFDPVTMSTLIALRRFHTASRRLPFEPAVKRVTTNVEHRADVAFLFPTFEGCHHFCT